MSKYQSLIVYGILIIFTGLFLMLFQHKSREFLQYSVAACMLVSAVFAITTAYKSKNTQVRFKYHELHALGMLVYGIAVLFFSATVAKFLSITSFFLIYYGTSEIIFCFWLFNLKDKIGFQVLLVRLVLGFSIYIGSVVILTLVTTNQATVLTWYGVIFTVIGIHVLLYRPIMKKIEHPMLSVV